MVARIFIFSLSLTFGAVSLSAQSSDTRSDANSNLSQEELRVFRVLKQIEPDLPHDYLFPSEPLRDFELRDRLTRIGLGNLQAFMRRAGYLYKQKMEGRPSHISHQDWHSQVKYGSPERNIAGFSFSVEEVASVIRFYKSIGAGDARLFDDPTQNPIQHSDQLKAYRDLNHLIRWPSTTRDNPEFVWKSMLELLPEPEGSLLLAVRLRYDSAGPDAYRARYLDIEFIRKIFFDRVLKLALDGRTDLAMQVYRAFLTNASTDRATNESDVSWILSNSPSWNSAQVLRFLIKQETPGRSIKANSSKALEAHAKFIAELTPEDVAGAEDIIGILEGNPNVLQALMNACNGEGQGTK